MTTAPARRALIYVRVSQDKKGGGLAVGRQRDDCQALADRLGWTVVGIHEDNDTSAYSGKPRPGYRALLADLEAGRADAVLVWHTDRLHRSPVELEEYVSVSEKHSVITQTVQSGELNLSTPSGRMIARQLGSVARYEVEHKSQRIRRKQEELAAAGKWLGGRPPLGWIVSDDGSAVLDRPAARRIKRATEDVIAGASFGSIVRAWNAAGFLTSTGKPWSHQTLRQVLRRPRNAGLTEFRGEIIGASEWPEIVTEDAWRSLVAILDDPARRRSQSNRARWLLAGVALCGGCGQPLKSSAVGRAGDGTNRHHYRCTGRGGGHVARNSRDLDEHVIETVAAWLDRDFDLLIGGPDDSLDAAITADLQGEALTVRARLTEAASTFADGMISRDQLGTITARCNVRLGEIEAALRASTRGAATAMLSAASDPVQAWRTAPVDRQRAILRELVEVVVLPRGAAGRRVYDPAFTLVFPR